jgi:hypothetical protein
MLKKLYGQRLPSWWNDVVMLNKLYGHRLDSHHGEMIQSC